MRRVLFVLLSCFVGFTNPSRADTFGSGDNLFEIEFVTIGSPGNAPDDPPNPAGAVPYVYRMGKYEISEQMIDKANLLGGLGITKDTRGPDKPATSITWFEAAKFVNWLNTSTSSVPAYKFDDLGAFQLWQPTDAGYNANNLYRNSLARYFLPSVDEWHKAAYFDPVAGHYWDYSTGRDEIPDGIDSPGDNAFDAVYRDLEANPGPNEIKNVGLLSAYGTAGQGGNIAEWQETAFDRINDTTGEHRRAPGGSWRAIHTVLAAWNTGIGDAPNIDFDFIGFRVASNIPEPCDLASLATGLLGMFGLRFGRHQREDRDNVQYTG